MQSKIQKKILGHAKTRKKIGFHNNSRNTTNLYQIFQPLCIFIFQTAYKKTKYVKDLAVSSLKWQINC